MRELLELLEASGEDLLPPLAYVAGRGVVLDEEELRGALRRAQLLLASGGDPRRPLEPDGRAVTAVAADLDGPGARAQLAAGLAALLGDVEGLPAVAGALRALIADADLAWRSYACALVAEDLAEQ